MIQNLNIPADEVIEQKTTQQSKLEELANYRFPDRSITQDSVMALGFAVIHRRGAHDTPSGGRIMRGLLDDLNATYRPANFAGSTLPWMIRN